MQAGNFSFGLSPAFSASSLGANFNVGYNDGVLNLGFSYGVGFNTGTNDLTGGFRSDSRGWFNAVGVNAGATINSTYYGGSWSSTKLGGKAGQKIGTFGLQIGDFGIRIDEDLFPGGDGKDRFRTGGGTATYRLNDDVTLAVGLAMITGHGTPSKTETGKFEKPLIKNEKPHAYRGGALYGGIIYRDKANFAGVNSEKILHGVQDRIHKWTGTPWVFENNRLPSRVWSYFGNYNANTLVY